MAKLKNIIKQLAQADYLSIYENLLDSSADKSAHLLKAMRERHLSDSKIMDELKVNPNAYYTLRSRLNQKIEEHLLQLMENPRTDILKKVANINEMIFTKKRAISVATLQKLEKELIDYDLSNELMVVYKHLKKLHINTPDFFTYSQLYNRHIAYMLAIDKAEDLMGEYFKKFAFYSLGGDETDKFELTLLHNELQNVAQMYQSHRLYVYKTCVEIFHRLFILPEPEQTTLEPIEEMFESVQKILNSYVLDSTYYHLNLVLDYLRLLFFHYYKLHRKSEKMYQDVNDSLFLLLSNYGFFTYPSQFFSTKIERALRLNMEAELYAENKEMFVAYENDPSELPRYLNYMTYRALCCYYVEKYEEAAKWINTALNSVSLKKYPHALMELKALLALQYCMMRDQDLFNQLVHSTQRIIRIVEKDRSEHIVYFIKIIKLIIGGTKTNRKGRLKSLVTKMANCPTHLFSPTKLIRLDDDFADRLLEEKTTNTKAKN
ncbi:MAG: hypothetical protein EAZ97_14465 [Bacteroidetes bacterium]|nr:MAG: hypothetical protein EAZ97_14465 [Bacteroidota bacterium]